MGLSVRHRRSPLRARKDAGHHGFEKAERCALITRVDSGLVVARNEGGRPLKVRVSTPTLSRIRIDIRMVVGVDVLKDRVAS